MLIEALMNSDLVNLDRLTTICKDGLVTVVTGRSGQLKSKSKKVYVKVSSYYILCGFVDQYLLLFCNWFLFDCFLAGKNVCTLYLS